MLILFWQNCFWVFSFSDIETKPIQANQKNEKNSDKSKKGLWLHQ
jgi:hypothetical protein